VTERERERERGGKGGEICIYSMGIAAVSIWM